MNDRQLKELCKKHKIPIDGASRDDLKYRMTELRLLNNSMLDDVHRKVFKDREALVNEVLRNERRKKSQIHANLGKDMHTNNATGIATAKGDSTTDKELWSRLIMEARRTLPSKSEQSSEYQTDHSELEKDPGNIVETCTSPADENALGDHDNDDNDAELELEAKQLKRNSDIANKESIDWLQEAGFIDSLQAGNVDCIL